jgi:hypothetical protein
MDNWEEINPLGDPFQAEWKAGGQPQIEICLVLRLLLVFGSIRSRTSIRDCPYLNLFDMRRKAAYPRPRFLEGVGTRLLEKNRFHFGAIPGGPPPRRMAGLYSTVRRVSNQVRLRYTAEGALQFALGGFVGFGTLTTWFGSHGTQFVREVVRPKEPPPPPLRGGLPCNGTF